MAEMNNVDKEDTISLIDIVLILTKRWKFIFFSSLIAAVLIFGYAFYTISVEPDAPFNYIVNFYQPEVKIRIEDSGSSVSSVLSQSGLGALTGLTGSGSGKMSSSELVKELLRGNTILDQIVEEFDLIAKYKIEKYIRTNSRLIVYEAIATNYNEDTGILTIKYTHGDPELATAILNRIVDLLEQRFKNLTMEKVLTKKGFLEERLTQVDKELKEVQNKLIEFQGEHGIVDIITTTDSSTSLKSREFVFSEYLPRSKRHEISSNYFNLERDRLILDGIYELLMQQYETAKIEEMDDTRIFQVIERAEVPERKAGPSRAKICMAVTVIVFILSILISFVLSYFEKAKRDPEESVKLRAIRNSFFKRNK